ncbi:MAG: acyl-CoA thioesterase [Alphaproteobacteria bacterium]|nr:acyl-CoA thioesterase [Alphaproteobacteria bacterium]
MSGQSEPRGELCIQTAAMPADTNPNGDIFGGWLLSQMDIAGGIAARNSSGGRVVTVAVESMVFNKPVQVGDVVCCYADLERTGNTSMAFRIEAWTIRRDSFVREKVTEGVFTYVAIGADGRPRPIPKETMQA